MKYFLSCDWGTTSFRLRLADISNATVLAEESSDEGIAETFNLWQQQNGGSAEERIDFYLAVIGTHIKKLEERVKQSLAGVKLIISGMASSTIGFIELPYSPVPLAIDGTGLQTGVIAAGTQFAHDVLIISGVKTNDDVMRGEETQLIGCIDAGQAIKHGLYIFPGTHSKHILIKDNHIAGIKTYMTGEVFGLLAQNSILKDALQAGSKHGEFDSFKKGVNDAIAGNLLHSAFKVRTNQLFGIYSKEKNFEYLSGLLIGTELKELLDSNADAINLVCGSNLEAYYWTALRELGLSNILQFSAELVDEAVVKGHYKIGRQLKILI